MTWTRLDENHFQRPEALGVSDRARLLEVAALVWSNATGQDGRITRGALRSLAPLDDDAAPVESYADELVSVGLWDRTASGWQVVGWAELQPTAEEVEQRKVATRESSERYRRHLRGDHSMCDRCAAVRSARVNGDASVTRHSSVSDASIIVSAPTRPDPSRNEVEERGGAVSGHSGPGAGAPLPSTPNRPGEKGESTTTTTADVATTSDELAGARAARPRPVLL